MEQIDTQIQNLLPQFLEEGAKLREWVQNDDLRITQRAAPKYLKFLSACIQLERKNKLEESISKPQIENLAIPEMIILVGVNPSHIESTTQIMLELLDVVQAEIFNGLIAKVDQIESWHLAIIDENLEQLLHYVATTLEESMPNNIQTKYLQFLLKIKPYLLVYKNRPLLQTDIEKIIEKLPDLTINKPLLDELLNGFELSAKSKLIVELKKLLDQNFYALTFKSEDINISRNEEEEWIVEFNPNKYGELHIKDFAEPFRGIVRVEFSKDGKIKRLLTVGMPAHTVNFEVIKVKFNPSVAVGIETTWGEDNNVIGQKAVTVNQNFAGGGFAISGKGLRIGDKSVYRSDGNFVEDVLSWFIKDDKLTIEFKAERTITIGGKKYTLKVFVFNPDGTLHTKESEDNTVELLKKKYPNIAAIKNLRIDPELENKPDQLTEVFESLDAILASFPSFEVEENKSMYYGLDVEVNNDLFTGTADIKIRINEVKEFMLNLSGFEFYALDVTMSDNTVNFELNPEVQIFIGEDTFWIDSIRGIYDSVENKVDFKFFNKSNNVIKAPTITKDNLNGKVIKFGANSYTYNEGKFTKVPPGTNVPPSTPGSRGSGAGTAVDWMKGQ